MSQMLLKLWQPEQFDVVLMCETFGQDPSRSVFKWFLLIMNCCIMFFHVILDLKIELSQMLLKLWLPEQFDAVLICKTFGHDPSCSVFEFHFQFQALRNSKRRLKIECHRYCSNFGYQNSLMLCSFMKLLGMIRVVQFLSFIFNFKL